MFRFGFFWFFTHTAVCLENGVGESEEYERMKPLNQKKEKEKSEKKEKRQVPKKQNVKKKEEKRNLAG